MINLMEGFNEDGAIPCPSCKELKAIQDILSGYQTFDNESPAVSVDLLVSEVKMWRAKESYERKLKSTLIASTIKKLEQQGHKVDGSINQELN